MKLFSIFIVSILLISGCSSESSKHNAIVKVYWIDSNGTSHIDICTGDIWESSNGYYLNRQSIGYCKEK